MSQQTCACGQKSKSGLQCGICQSPTCKQCAHFLEEGQFSFLKQVPADLAHSVFCDSCYSEKVAPELRNYEELLEKAKEILVYMKSQAKETRLIKRLADPVRVVKCADYDEAILRMAFFAAQAGFNAIIDVDLKSEKVRDGSYQTTVWSGTGMPANVRVDQLVKDRSIWQNPN